MNDLAERVLFMLNSCENGVIWFIMRLVHYNDKSSQLIRLTLRAGALPVSSEAAANTKLHEKHIGVSEA